MQQVHFTMYLVGGAAVSSIPPYLYPHLYIYVYTDWYMHTLTYCTHTQSTPPRFSCDTNLGCGNIRGCNPSYPLSFCLLPALYWAVPGPTLFTYIGAGHWGGKYIQVGGGVTAFKTWAYIWWPVWTLSCVTQHLDRDSCSWSVVNTTSCISSFLAGIPHSPPSL